MLELKYTNKFKKDYRLIEKRGYDINKLKDVIEILTKNHRLPEKYREYFFWQEIINGFRECHIEPDWLLIYYIDDEKMILILSRTGTHSDLF